MQLHELYMHRCIQLAKLGKGQVGSNPMVGSVLVHQGQIIGEGYHMKYGKAHAEVNCINSVVEEERKLISKSTLYVSLEPCAHFGKTPPCADLIIAQKIPKVVIGCTDPFEKVAGKGIDKLRHAGVEVEVGLLEKECLKLNKRFFKFHTEQRPFVILKWAQSSNHAIANNDGSRVLISNELTNRLVHKWRGEEAGILVGTRTALLDNPALNVRFAAGKNPVRLVFDLNNKLPGDLKLFDQTQQTFVFNYERSEVKTNLKWIKIEKGNNSIKEILKACYQNNIRSILVEGGTKTLQFFIDNNLWDEARVITNGSLIIKDGYAAPFIRKAAVENQLDILADRVTFYKNQQGNKDYAL
ncbi:MAG: ribD [Segetibacter sp.]|nr:ribD [Segetibacter sp.]